MKLFLNNKNKRSCFWIVYKSLSGDDKKEFMRWHFWAWIMDQMPRIYKLCDKYLPFNTLPF